MSIHPSLKVNKYKEKRNVRSRRERVEKLIRNFNWLEKNKSVYGLPKEKIVHLKLKIKTEKIEKKEVVPLYASIMEETKKKKKKSRDDKETKK